MLIIWNVRFQLELPLKVGRVTWPSSLIGGRACGRMTVLVGSRLAQSMLARCYNGRVFQDAAKLI